jgi:predicted DCC family thiol-disulfide oxidoreductase YuxK
MSLRSINTPQRIVYFDGHCNLCNGFVDFLIRRHESLLFAPLQGETFQKRHPHAPLTSIAYEVDTEFWSESTAAIKILGDLGGLWSYCQYLLLIPAPFRNFVYRLVAKNRYKVFGRSPTCRLPSLTEKMRFLP